MNHITKAKMWVVGALRADSAVSAIVEARVFSVRTGEAQPAPFCVAMNFREAYASCKDGSIAEALSFSVLCVAASAEQAAELADRVAAALNCASADDIGDCLLTEIADNYDYEQQEYVCSVEFLINL